MTAVWLNTKTSFKNICDFSLTRSASACRIGGGDVFDCRPKPQPITIQLKGWLSAKDGILVPLDLLNGWALHCYKSRTILCFGLGAQIPPPLLILIFS